MAQLIKYFENNDALVYITVGILIASVAVIAFIFFARKSVVKKRQQNIEFEEATRELYAKPITTNEELFLDPSMNSSTLPPEKSDSESDDASDDEESNSDEVNSTANVDEKEDNTTEKPAYKPVNTKNDGEQGFRKATVIKVEPKQKSTVITKNKVEEKPAEAEKEQASPQHKASQKVYPTRTKTEEKPARYSGKWLIYIENGRYAANLLASNGEILLRSETYSALSGVKSGIETIKNNVEKDNFAISVDKKGKYSFKLYSAQTRLLCISEGYSTKALCESAIESVKRFAKTAVLEVKKEENQ